MAATSSMFMYSMTLQPPTAIQQAIAAQFLGNKEQQLLTASGSRLIMYRVDQRAMVLVPIMSHDVFGMIRRLASFRVAGASKDYLVISSDSGRIAILEYLNDENRFKRVHLETYGKSGVRRVVPGEYLAADPKGRACMVAAVEKNKLGYVLNRTTDENLTISSPLEAHKPHAVLFDLVALDVAFENPVFAALEQDYGDVDPDQIGPTYDDLDKELVYYELELGLNHVVRKWSEAVDRAANKLIPVPGGSDGPSGVLVCSREFIIYHHSSQPPVRIQIPRRDAATEDFARKRIIIASTMHKMRGTFFFLVETDDGDIFKLTFDLIKGEDGKFNGGVAALEMRYFDTIPVASHLCIMKSGFVFAAHEQGNHGLYQVLSLGDDEDGRFSSNLLPDDFPTPLYPDMDPAYDVATFRPRESKNIDLASSLPSLHPLIALKAVNIAYQDAPELYAICGSGANSSFKNVRHGLRVIELIAQDLPDQPTKIFTCRIRSNDTVDAYIILSYSDVTIVLGVGDFIEQIEDSGLKTDVPTLAVQQMGFDSLIQIYPKGMRQLSASTGSSDWQVPQHRTIVAVATNTQQIALGLSTGQIIYFEMDDEGELSEYGDMAQMNSAITALSIGEVPEGRQRSPFLAVASDDATVRILSLAPESTLRQKSVQAITASACALLIMSMVDSFTGSPTLYLHIGLTSGVYIRTILDEVTGDLSDTRSRFLGVRPVKLYSVQLPTQRAVLAVTTKSWFGYADEQTKMFTLTPLDYASLQMAWSFHSDQCPHGLIGVDAKKQLRFVQVHKLDNHLRHESTPLLNTPRAFVNDSRSPYFYIIEADYNVLSSQNRRILAESNEGKAEAELPPKQFGYPKAKQHWSSCLQIVNPIGFDSTSGQPALEDLEDGRRLEAEGVVETIEFEGNECATAVALTVFAAYPEDTYLIVGTGEGLTVSPRTYKRGWLVCYRLVNGGRGLELVHRTEVPAPPTALEPFQGRVLAGIGKDLIWYDVGLKQMLRKLVAFDAVPNILTGIKCFGRRIACSDVQESVTFVLWIPKENRLLAFVDDVVARWTTASTMVDYQTAAGGDKFGNIWMVRIPKKLSKEAEELGAAGFLLNTRPYLGGRPARSELMVHNFINDIPTSMQKVSLISGQKEMLIYSGFSGMIGALIPFDSREDVNFFQQLETELRKEDPPLLGRDHLAYRSYYAPVKDVIDGDLCERYYRLSKTTQEKIAAELERSVREVIRKIGDLRTKHAF